MRLEAVDYSVLATVTKWFWVSFQKSLIKFWVFPFKSREWNVWLWELVQEWRGVTKSEAVAERKLHGTCWVWLHAGILMMDPSDDSLNLTFYSGVWELSAGSDNSPCHRCDSGLVLVGQVGGAHWCVTVFCSALLLAVCHCDQWHYAFKLLEHSSQSWEQAFKEQFKFWPKSLTEILWQKVKGHRDLTKNLLLALTQESVLWQSFLQMYPRIKCWGDDIFSSEFKGQLFWKYTFSGQCSRP